MYSDFVKKPTISLLIAFAVLVASLWLQFVVLNAWTVQASMADVSVFVVLLLLMSGVFTLLVDKYCRLIESVAVQHPGWLQPVSVDLARRYGVKPPRISLLACSGINAFAMDSISRRGNILCNAAVLTHLNQDEVEAVLAHEFGHLAGHHALLLSLMQGMVVVFTLPLAILLSLFYVLVHGLDKLWVTSFSLNQKLTVMLFPFTSLLIAVFNRRWELDADRMAAMVIGKERYVQTLECLHAGTGQQANPEFSQSVPIGQPRGKHWALSHPNLTQRIAALREIGV